MLITFTKKNKYGGYTHEIEILPYLLIRLNEMNSTTINVELIEKRVLQKEKIHFSFSYPNTLVNAINIGYSEMKHPVRHTPQEQLDHDFLDSHWREVINFVIRHQDDIKKKSIVQFK
jgi:hypothetical protein